MKTKQGGFCGTAQAGLDLVLSASVVLTALLARIPWPRNRGPPGSDHAVYIRSVGPREHEPCFSFLTPAAQIVSDTLRHWVNVC